MWSETVGLRTKLVWNQKKIGLGLGLAGLVLCRETRSCHARRHNDLEGHSNFSSTIYYGRTLSERPCYILPMFFSYFFFIPALVGQTAERIFTKLSHVVDIRHHLRTYYPVSQKKLWSQTLVITLSNLNRFQKFLHCCKEKEISNKPCVIIPTTP